MMAGRLGWLIDRWKPARRWVLSAVGVGLLAFIVTTLDRNAVASAMRETNGWLLAAAFAAGIPMIWVKSVRWARVLALLGVSVPPIAAGRLYAAGLFTAYPTPGQVGEIAKVAYLERYGCSRSLGLVSIAGDRLIDVVLLTLLALPGLGYFLPGFSNKVGASISLILLVAGLLILSLALWSAPLSHLAAWGWKQIGSRLGGLSAAALARPSMGKVILLVVAAFAAQAIVYGRLGLALEALGIDLAAHAFFTGLAAMSLVTAMPISVAGIGTREFALVVLFEQVGLTREMAVVFAAAVLLVHLSSALVGFVAWMVSARIGGSASDGVDPTEVLTPRLPGLVGDERQAGT